MNILRSMLVLAMLLLATHAATAQANIDTSAAHTGQMYIIIKNDGTRFVGTIISSDAREILIDTKSIGQVSVPKHELKEMRPVTKDEIDARGQFKPCETFATRYFLTTNGLPIRKGESYILWNWYGPDIQFGVAKNFGIGVITTWIGAPAIVSAKYSMELDAHTHLAIGALAGTGSWARSDLGLAVPFASLTWGNRRNNFTVSGGYGQVRSGGTGSGRVLLSVAGMVQITEKASFVFDSFIMPGNGSDKGYGALYVPGIRLQTAHNKAFQFGFAGIDNGSHVSPIPMLQWFRML